jgi:hypothetical protein
VASPTKTCTTEKKIQERNTTLILLTPLLGGKKKNGTGAGFHIVLRLPLPILIPSTAPRSLITLSSTPYSLDTDSVVIQHILTLSSHYLMEFGGKEWLTDVITYM